MGQEQGKVTVVFVKGRDGDYAFPNVCACCLEPTTLRQQVEQQQTVGIPIVAAVTRTHKFAYPLCQKCKNLREKAGSGRIAGIVAVGGVSVLGIAGGVGLYLAGIPADWCVAVAPAVSVVGILLYFRSSSRAKARALDLPEYQGHPPYCLRSGGPIRIRMWNTNERIVKFDIFNTAFAAEVCKHPDAAEE